jgi:hypothetical protein
MDKETFEKLLFLSDKSCIEFVFKHSPNELDKKMPDFLSGIYHTVK